MLPKRAVPLRMTFWTSFATKQAAEKEKQTNARLAREVKDKEAAALVLRRKMREQGLVDFEATRNKDAEDRVVKRP